MLSSSDWLLVSSGIFQGIFAILVTYWGNRIHRAAWMGGLFMLQAVMCLIIIVPTLAHKLVQIANVQRNLNFLQMFKEFKFH